MYLVTGATGQVGGALADCLLSRGARVRVFVRSQQKGELWRERGAEVSIGTFDDVPALTAAMAGVAGVFLMQPNDFASQDFLGDGLARSARYLEALAGAGNPKVALLSSVGSHLPDVPGPMRREHQFEQAFADYPDARVVRPGYFIENWANVMEAVSRSGVLPTFLRAEEEIPMVAVQDIGDALARALMSPEAPRVLELAGPRDESPNTVAEALSALTGNTVRVAPSPPDHAAQMFQGLGFSPHISELVADMYHGYQRGVIAFSGEPHRGHTTLTASLRALLSHGAS